MGTMSFRLPPEPPASATDDLRHACLAGGFDNAPGPTQTTIQSDRLTLKRAVDESGFLITPWPVNGVGRVMTSTATLMERAEPYSLAVELARGKVNQVRNHVADWGPLGVELGPELDGALIELSRHFGRAIADYPPEAADREALRVLAEAYRLTDRLVPRYTEELFRIRHQHVPKLETPFGCQLHRLPGQPDVLADSFNTLRLGLAWRLIEPTESQYDWAAADAIVDWADSKSMPVTAGPLIDFSAIGVPDWLWIWQGDLSNIANFMCDYVETAIGRYCKRIRRWFLATGCNVGGLLGLSEDDLLWLTARLTEAAMQIAPEAEIVLGVAQPWGDYMARDEHTYTPLVFLDTLLRTGLRLTALDVELVMGVAPQGSYWRDLLDVSRLLDAYAVLSTPVQVTLGVPCSRERDPLADPKLTVGLGDWGGTYDEVLQADRGGTLATLAVSKPFVNGVYWTHLSDAQPHRFPNCGLLDEEDRPRPILEVLRTLRQTHLR
jgi:hypothetical protein